MVSSLDDTKRLSIATKLADMKALQNLLINNNSNLSKIALMSRFASAYRTEHARRRSQKPGARLDGCFQLRSSKQANPI
jgi:hypothetical protein